MAREQESIKTIAVIVGLDLIGDALIKLPFVRALRVAYPDAHISWLTAQGKSAYAGPLRELVSPYLDHILEQPAFLTDQSGLTVAPPFDLVIDTRGRWRYALQARRLPHKVFIAPAAWRRLEHIQDRLLQLVTLASGRKPVVNGGIDIPREFRAKAELLLPTGQTYIGLVPGAGNTIKIWPLPRFIDLAQQQVAAKRVPVFLLGPQETGWRAELERALPAAKFPLQDPLWGGQLSLEATMAVGERLALTVTNDNGTSHMLAAVDCPIVSLFGPTAARKLAPRVSHSRIVTSQQFGQDNMAAIPVNAVADDVDDLLQEVCLAN